jgi:hypothetical protein
MERKRHASQALGTRAATMRHAARMDAAFLFTLKSSAFWGSEINRKGGRGQEEGLKAKPNQWT